MIVTIDTADTAAVAALDVALQDATYTGADFTDGQRRANLRHALEAAGVELNKRSGQLWADRPSVAEDQIHVAVRAKEPAIWVTPGDGSVTVYHDNDRDQLVPHGWTNLHRELMVVRLRHIADRLAAVQDIP